jgi:ammonia channel protein AmtB
MTCGSVGPIGTIIINLLAEFPVGVSPVSSLSADDSLDVFGVHGVGSWGPC